jgi:hypothetical protein
MSLPRKLEMSSRAATIINACCGELDQTFVGGEGRRSIFSIAITSDPPSNECEQLA